MDVRCYSNHAVSEANCLCSHLMRGVVSFSSLFPGPEFIVAPHALDQNNAKHYAHATTSINEKEHSIYTLLTGAISTVEGRSIEGLATSLSVALTWKTLSGAKNGEVSQSTSFETCDVLAKWVSASGVPEQAEVAGVEKVFLKIY